MTKAAFLAQFLDDALAVQATYRINAAVVLAVSSWEGAWGESTNVKVGNNHFGIKVGSKPNPYGTGSRPAPDGGSYVIYPSVRASFLDFGRLLTQKYPTVAALSYDADAFAKAFVGSGYMTDPNRWTTYYPTLRSRTREFATLLPKLATTGLGIGSILIGGAVAWLIYHNMSSQSKK